MIYTSAISTTSLLWIFADLAALILAIISLLHYLSLKDKLAQKKTKTNAFVPLYVLAFGSSIFGPVTLALFLGVALVFLLMSLSLKKQSQTASAIHSSKPETAPMTSASLSEEKTAAQPMVTATSLSEQKSASKGETPMAAPLSATPSPVVSSSTASTTAVSMAPAPNEGASADKEVTSAAISPKTKAVVKPVNKDRPYPKGYTYAINLEELLPAYHEGETVSLESLQSKGLAPKEAKRIKCLGHLPLTKKLVFDVADYSGDAYGVITASGSTVLRRGEIKIHG